MPHAAISYGPEASAYLPGGDTCCADEFVERREALAESGRHTPAERLASFLVFLSRDNAHNGRDASIIADNLRCGVVADLLQFSVDDLEAHLIGLQKRGLIQPTESGALELLDLPQLETFASGVFPI